MRPALRAAIGTAVGIALLAAVLWRVDLDGVGASIRALSWPLLALGWAVKLTPIPLKIVRWRLELAPALHRPPRAVGRSAMIGWFLNTVLPLELGTLARVRICHQRNGAPFATVFATLAVERTLDILVLVSLLAVCVVFTPLPEAAAGAALPLVGAGLVMGLLLLWWAGQRDLPIPEVVRRTWWGAWLATFAGRFASGLASVRSPVRVLVLGLLTLACWLLEAVGMWLVFQAFHLSLTPLAALVLTVALALGMAIRTAPAGLGTHQVVCVGVLSLYDVAPETALALSVTVQAVVVASLAALGAPALLWESLTPPPAADNSAMPHPSPLQEAGS